ncbi:MAG: hypothetical protein N3E49_02640 [Bacteroidia bacterium]|nr:hypothetical protein [Bacteroidia bacterium]
MERGLRTPLLWGGLGAIAAAQRVLVGPSGKDSVLSAGKLMIRYEAPAGWQRDTFILTVRNAIGIVTRARLKPQPNGPHQAEISLLKPGFFVLLVQHPKVGGRIWASHRLYVLAPPYTTIGQVRAYHNTLLARKPTSVSYPPELPEELIPLVETFPDASPPPDVLIEEDTLPDDRWPSVEEEVGDSLDDDVLEDD